MGLNMTILAGILASLGGSSSSYMIASNRFALPTDWGTNDNGVLNDGQGGRTGGSGTTLYAYYKRRLKFTTTWAPKQGRWLWANASNSLNAILDSLFANTVQRAEVRLASDLSLVDTIKWAGATSRVLSPGEKVWNDPVVDLLPNTTYYLDYFGTAPAHASFPTGRGLYLTGEVLGESLSDLSAGSMGTGPAGSAVGGYFEPACFVAKGWDGSPTPLLFGDSILDGTNVCPPLATSRGDIGHIQGACGDATSGVWNYCSSARYSASFAATSQDNLNGLGGKNIVDWFADACVLLGQSSPVFNVAWSEHGRNSLGTSSTLFSIQDAFNTFANKLQSRYPGMKIVQQTTTPTAVNTANYYGTSEATQTTSGANSDAGGNGIIRQWNNWVISGCGGRALGIDTASVCRGIAYDKWAVPAFAATLVNAITANNTNVVTLSVQPPLGTHLVFEAGDATNADASSSTRVYGVAAVVANGLNWDCTLNANRWGYQSPLNGSYASRVQKAHSAGVSVLASGSSDGLHPPPDKQLAMQAYNVTRKSDITSYIAS